MVTMILICFCGVLFFLVDALVIDVNPTSLQMPVDPENRNPFVIKGKE